MIGVSMRVTPKGMIPIALIGWEMSGDDEAYAWLLPD